MGVVVAILGFAAFLFLTVGLPILLTARAAGQARAYHYTDVVVDASVLADGSLQLEEHRTVDFRNGTFTYGTFSVAEPPADIHGFSVSQEAPGGEVPLEFSASPSPDQYTATFHYDVTDAPATFVFRYRVSCAVAVYADTAQLLWQFVGRGWTEETDRVVATVHLPGDARASSVPRPGSCDPTAEAAATVPGTTPIAPGATLAWGHGRLNGTVTVVDPQTVRFEAADVPPGQFVEGSLLFPTDVVPRAAMVNEPARARILSEEAGFAAEANRLRADHRRDVRTGQVLLLAIPLVLALLVLLARFRDRVPGVPATLAEPPEDDPVDVALLWTAWRGSLSPVPAYRTQLLQLARIGAITIEAVGPVTDPEDLIARRGRDAGTDRDRRFVDLLFPTEEDTVSLMRRSPHADTSGISPAARYAAWWDNAKARSGDVVQRISKGDARIESVGAFAIGIGSLVAAIWLAARHTGVWVWLLPVEGVIGMIVALRLIPARVGVDIRERVARLVAFRRFLRRFSDLPNAPTLAVVIWEQYLVFATALGVADEVEKQVTALIPAASLGPPLPGAPAGASSVGFWNAVAASAPGVVLAGTASASSSSSSGSDFGSFSSSSGFGGGFSSGGGGGGGGTGGGFG